MEETYVNSQE
jgi:sorting nexin-8